MPSITLANDSNHAPMARLTPTASTFAKRITNVRKHVDPATCLGYRFARRRTGSNRLARSLGCISNPSG
jgi:hypothetical protein